MTPASPPAAVALLSGGMDSAVAAASIREEGRAVHALSIEYGQRHLPELDAARSLVGPLGLVSHRLVRIDLRALGGSSLTTDAPIPKDRPHDTIGSGVPSTYVPARNAVFLSVALGLAEIVGATEIVIGANALDYSGYPDCREPFLRKFEELASVATAAGTEDGVRFRVRAPLLEFTKAEIILRAVELGVPLDRTWSCYDPVLEGTVFRACARCDSCLLRRRGFEQAGVPDPTAYSGLDA